MANRDPKAPKAYEEFVKQYPKLDEAWQAIHDAGRDGPLDERTARLVTLAQQLARDFPDNRELTRFLNAHRESK